MKLNKVLALALSGVMAVSMLAGCKGDSGNGGQGGQEQPPVDSIAADINDELSDANKKKISFVDSADLEGKLTTAIELNGTMTLPGHEDVAETMGKLTGKKADQATYDSMIGNTKAKNYEVLLVRTYEDKTTLASALNDFMGELNHWMSDMPYAYADGNKQADADALKTALESMNEGDTYIQYAYTGNVAVVQATDYAGENAQYYFVVTIAQTASTAVVG